MTAQHREALRPMASVQQFDDENWTVWLGTVRLTTFPSQPSAEDCAEKVNAFAAILLQSQEEALKRAMGFDAEELGETIYAAFRGQCVGWQPEWKSLEDEGRKKWRGVALAAARHLLSPTPTPPDCLPEGEG